MQYCHVFVYIPFGLNFFSSHNLPQGGFRHLVIMVFYITVGPESLFLTRTKKVLLIGSSSLFLITSCNFLLQVFFRVFLSKLTMQPFIFQLSSFSSLFQDVLNSFLLTVSSLSISPVILTPCSKTSQEFLTYNSKLFSSPHTTLKT